MDSQMQKIVHSFPWWERLSGKIRSYLVLWLGNHRNKTCFGQEIIPISLKHVVEPSLSPYVQMTRRHFLDLGFIFYRKALRKWFMRIRVVNNLISTLHSFLYYMQSCRRFHVHSFSLVLFLLSSHYIFNFFHIILILNERNTESWFISQSISKRFSCRRSLVRCCCLRRQSEMRLMKLCHKSSLIIFNRFLGLLLISLS